MVKGERGERRRVPTRKSSLKGVERRFGTRGVFYFQAEERVISELFWGQKNSSARPRRNSLSARGRNVITLQQSERGSTRRPKEKKGTSATTIAQTGENVQRNDRLKYRC